MQPAGAPGTWVGGGGFPWAEGAPAAGGAGGRICRRPPIGGSSDGRGGLQRRRGRGRSEPGGEIGPWGGTEVGGRTVNYMATGWEVYWGLG